MRRQVGALETQLAVRQDRLKSELEQQLVEVQASLKALLADMADQFTQQERQLESEQEERVQLNQRLHEYVQSVNALHAT